MSSRVVVSCRWSSAKRVRPSRCCFATYIAVSALRSSAAESSPSSAVAIPMLTSRSSSIDSMWNGSVISVITRSAACSPRGVRQQDRELVTAQPGDGVPASHGPPQPLGDLDEEQVAEVVAVGVVDVLEAVQVQHQHRRRSPRPSVAVEDLVELLDEEDRGSEGR